MVLPVFSLAAVRSWCAEAACRLDADSAALWSTASPVGASDATQHRLEHWQFVVGEGPCVDALADQRPVMVEVFGSVERARWPIFSGFAERSGVRSMMVMPIVLGETAIGALALTWRSVGSRRVDERLASRTLAGAARIVCSVLSHTDLDAAGNPPQPFERSCSFFDCFSQAVGAVMSQLGISAEDASARLRATAFATDTPLDEVASGVLTGSVRLYDDDCPHPGDQYGGDPSQPDQRDER